MGRPGEGAIERKQRIVSDRRVFLRWVRATWIGWMVGVPCIVALALLGEAVGIGGSQVLVGAGMGAGIGIFQARVIRGWLPRAAPWFWSCVGGLALPFLATDIAKLAGYSSTRTVYVSVALGGLIVGAWQALILRERFRSAGWWLASSAVGWTLAGGTAMLADSLSHTRQLRGLGGALAYLGIVALGGLVLGLVTGMSLVRLARQDSSSPRDVRLG